MSKCKASISHLSNYLCKKKPLLTIPMSWTNPKHDYRLVCHGDDLAAEGSREALDNLDQWLRKAFKITCQGFLGPGSPGTLSLLKRTLMWCPHGFGWCADPSHPKSIVRLANLEEAQSKGGNVVGSKTIGKTRTDQDEELPEQDKRLYAMGAGLCLYHSSDRPDTQFGAARLMSCINSPKVRDEMALKAHARYLKAHEECIWLFRYQQAPEGITIFCDSDWAGDEVERKSTDCVHEYHGIHLLETSSANQGVTALASGEAEFYANVRAGAAGLQWKGIHEHCFKGPCSVTIYTDSTAAMGILRRSGCGKLRHIETKFLWIQQKVRDFVIRIKKVDTSLNTSDLGTKYHARARHEELVQMMPIVIGNGLRAGGLDVLFQQRPVGGHRGREGRGQA